MKILFLHQNFPGQFKHLAPALVRLGHDVRAMTMKKVDSLEWEGVRLVPYAVSRGTTAGVHPWVMDFETKVIRGQACFQAAIGLREAGFTPDVVIAHPGWGESLFVKEVWPSARLGLYSEFHYHLQGADTGFDPEFPVADPVGDACRLRLKNLNNLVHFEIADSAISPTEWQASTFPQPFRDRITVVHDGIDTRIVAPDPGVRLLLRSGSDAVTLTRQDEVITFVNRHLEPYRGYHVFMRALPAILRQRPHARVLIVGGDDVSYGARPDPARYGQRSWKQIFIDEVRPSIPEADWARVRFLGNVPYQHFIPLLQLSTVHVYLTYPFVLSWSLLEAMSAGCAIVASDTQPLREAIQHDANGRLVDFFDVDGLAGQVCQLLEDPDTRTRLGAAARDFACRHYDLETVCLPRQLEWVQALARQA
jgi:glycosyltransferase involved in cell wall biosynthesis